ncbi:glutathione-dependent reductase [Rhizobium sp. AC44/96]|nr:glutathione-dependent reductase [Rhizobium sp. AC44/96]
MECALLVNGRWTEDWQPVQAKDSKGGFVRQTSSFRSWVTPDGSAGPTGEAGFQAEAGRYHLYVAYICPWASRTLIGRKLKGLESAISVSIVEPSLTKEGWRFGTYPGATEDHIQGATYMHEIYTSAASDFTGRATVPVLWDKHRQTIVNNESSDILRMMNDGFGTLATHSSDLYPAEWRAQIDAFNERIYPSLNNGVYRAGFATTQIAYEEAFAGVFDCLDWVEPQLENRAFLFADHPTESDIRLFVTLVRFDVAYHGLFKCNLRRLSDYANLRRFCRNMLDWPGIAETVNFDHIKRGYYSIESLNPTRIVPVGPALAEIF